MQSSGCLARINLGFRCMHIVFVTENCDYLKK